MTAMRGLCAALTALALWTGTAIAWNHPRELTLVKRNMVVGTLQFQPHPNGGVRETRQLAVDPRHQGQRTANLGLGVYVMTVIVNGYRIGALIDTGSDFCEVACTGVKGDPRNPVTIYDPTKAKPPFIMINKTQPICSTYCSLSTEGGCLYKSAVRNACEFRYGYADYSYYYGRLYSGVMSFPAPVTLPKTANSVSPFYFACAYQASTSPYMFSGFSALFGMSWQKTSFWGQMQSAKLLQDSTMYLCLGNGGDMFNKSQPGLIIFGQDNAVKVTGASVGGEVVTVKLVNPYVQKLPVPTPWVQLTGMRLGNTTVPTISDFYLIDSGTSRLMLTQPHFELFNAWFCPALRKIRQVSYCDDSNPEYFGYWVTMNRRYSYAMLDKLLPPIQFILAGANRAVEFRPSQYMIFDGGRDYRVQIDNSTDVGVFGNLWMNGWLIQQSQTSGYLKMTRVKSCNDVAY